MRIPSSSRAALAAVLVLAVACAVPAEQVAQPTPADAPASGSARGTDWPQWRGLARDGVSAETGWVSPGAPEPLWRASVGLGYSSMVVAGGRLVTAGFDDAEGLDRIRCLEASSGREIWKHSYPAKRWAKFHGGGTNSTPSIDGDRVFSFDREGRLYCLAAADGSVRWARDVTADFEVTLPEWGFAGSPLVLDDALVINAGRAIAFDKTTGDVKWQSDDYGDAYATPVDVTAGGRRAIAIYAGKGLALVDRADGKQIGLVEWRTQYDVNAATPVRAGERLFISSGYDHGCALIDVSGAPRIAWENKAMRNQMSGCVLVGDYLYGFDDQVLKCIDLTGEERWRERGLGQGSLCASDGRLIVIGGKGDLLVLEATPEAYRVLSRRRDALSLDNGAKCWTMPVLSHGLIYCRNSAGELVCFDHRAQAGEPAPQPAPQPVRATEAER